MTRPVVVVKNAIGSITSHDNSQNVNQKKNPTCTTDSPSPVQRMWRTCLCASTSISSFFASSFLSSSLTGSSSEVRARGTALLTRSTT
ncbi:hypothetical protein SLEP1_g21035 [Rubroshorea leprosula]|uniref:Uncharacterized protein n=1 Tax=Rubroshorea leprosula TaxID=152421 RepID=A0AAV5JF77_9ROSI|nr:hypothetical protein SLEP1_g21035 [Rubroshorea leprosula]